MPEARRDRATAANQLDLMLRTLLAERFTLVVHTEMRGQPVYALVVDSSDGRLGPKLKPSTECDKNARMNVGAGVPSSAAPTPQILPCAIRTVSDARGTALQEQLGLKLESQRGPVEFLVVDRIERPTPD
jgi:uncharacterized protein (TIGR03435 family)